MSVMGLIGYSNYYKLFMPPTLKSGGHIGFGLSVCVCMYVFRFEISSCNFMYGFLMEK